MRFSRHFAQRFYSNKCAENGTICEKCSVYAGLRTFKGDLNYARKSCFAHSCRKEQKYTKISPESSARERRQTAAVTGRVGVSGEVLDCPSKPTAQSAKKKDYSKDFGGLPWLLTYAKTELSSILLIGILDFAEYSLSIL